MRTLNRTTALVAAGLAGALALAACSSDAEEPGDSTPEPTTEPTTEPEGDDDGPLVIYSGRAEDLVAPLIAQFEQATGIETEVRYGSTSEIASLLLEEGDVTPAHVFLSQESGALGAVSEAGLFTTLPDDVAGRVPADLTSVDGSWVAVTGRARVVAYDAEQLDESEVPDTLESIVDERWAGQIGFAPGNASFKSFVTAIRLVEGEDAALAWLQQLADLDPVIFENNRSILAGVDDGTVQIGLINHYYWFGLAAEQGADNVRAQQKFGAPGDPAALINVTGAGILNSAADRSDALAFVEYLLSNDAQDYFVETTYEYGLIDGIATPEGVPPLADIPGPDVDPSELGSIAETDALLVEAGLL